MRVQIFSDLHADVLPPRQIGIGTDVDVVIAAGDICEGAVQSFAVLRHFVPAAVPIVFVLGNHEYYRSFVPNELAAARKRAATHNIHLLENDTVVINGVRLAGATLWTDYALFGAEWRQRVMDACRHGLNDHRLIGWRKQPWEQFRPQEALLLHQQSREYLGALLAERFAGVTVAVTHHAPPPGSIAECFRTTYSPVGSPPTARTSSLPPNLTSGSTAICTIRPITGSVPRALSAIPMATATRTRSSILRSLWRLVDARSLPRGSGRPGDRSSTAVASGPAIGMAAKFWGRLPGA
ncbi:metallophosphoesterase [Rhodopseudomonas palustris TIE-1]|uniref:metallophosphoesterase n=1 Tax=Rhodopseudomonas palustris TaxID=1076 RepID=UPI000164B0FB|nr:metallophosphoesterase [Rhodopseudomonas palustris]ACF00045.1 metallophosphoesterase [Rhodopseudomonas palustris TIE-1]